MLALGPEVLRDAARSPYLQAVHEGYGRLRFSGRLEAEFERYFNEAHLARMRWAGYLAVAIYSLFVLMDVLTLTADIWPATLAIRLGLVMPTLLLALWATYQPRLNVHMQSFILLGALVAGLGTDVVIGIAEAHRQIMPYEGILVVTLFVYFMPCLLWSRALIAGLSTFIVFVLIEYYTLPSADLRMYHAAFMFAANFIGAAGNYFFEYSTRTTFLSNGLLRELAERDGLTGLYNRRTFNEHLDRAFRQAVRERTGIAVVMLDIDYFKQFNDHYGHGDGDAALQAVAEAIGQHARRPLDMVARYGGEEFVALWYDPREEDLDSLGERLRLSIERRAIPHLKSPFGGVTVSIGISYFPADQLDDVAEALRVADVALYLAKEQGRNRVVIKRRMTAAEAAANGDRARPAPKAV